MKLRLSGLMALFLLTVLISQAKLTPVKLTCEYMDNPPVVDVLQPRLAWVNIASEGERGQRQTAWQIRVASSPEKLDSPDLWDSGRVPGDESNRMVYAGKHLQSRMECWWQVRVWDRHGVVSGWSEPAFWRMGLLDPQEWKALWIGAPWQGEETLPKPNNPGAPLPEKLPPPAPLFRKEFKVQKPVEKAVAFVTGLGYFELWLNGQKVGEDVLVPNQTNYGKRPGLMDENIPLPDHFRDYKVMYLAYDVKDLLVSGANALGGIVGNGFYNPAKYWAGGYGTPRFLLQLYVTYEDGSEEVVVSDASWKAAKSPILMDMVFYGEHYDARLDIPGWNRPGFDDVSWEPVAIRKAPEGRMAAHTAHPDRIMERISPLSIRKLENGNHFVDFGEEVSGWVRLNNVRGPAGHKIEIKYNSNTYSGDNSYIFRGEGPESYAARFNWFIFSSVEVVNWPGELTPDMLTAEVVYTWVEETAKFETSNQMFNDINKIWRRSQTDNMHGGIASDCPHRERSAYTGDGQVACVTVIHNYDARNFYQKWIQDILSAQNPDDGYVPNGAPWQPGCGGGVAWGAAICIMPWEFYLHYGSTDMLEDNFTGMKEYVRYMQNWVGADGIMHMQRTGRNGQVLRWFNLGDWVTPGALPPDEMVHTFYLWRCADITAQTAKILGEMADAEKYAALAENTREAFWKRFYDEQSGSYGKAGGNIFALRMGVPGEQYAKVTAALRRDIAENKGHLDTGIFGTQFFFEVLSENGMHELAYEAMNKKEEPGYGRWLELGSTTTREQWSEAGSHNHPMFGGGLVWFYRKLAGMETDPAKPGYRHIIFRPQPAGDISFAEYYNETTYGTAGIRWDKKEDEISVRISVPVGCQATVHVPVKPGQSVSESGKPVASAAGVTPAGEEPGYRMFRVESGEYWFTAR